MASQAPGFATSFESASVNGSGAMGLSASLAYESECNTNQESITGLTQLYDLEHTFTSTPEMDDLLPLITRKYRELLNVQAECCDSWVGKTLQYPEAPSLPQ